MAEKKKINMKEYFGKFTPEQQKTIAKSFSNGMGSKKPEGKKNTKKK